MLISYQSEPLLTAEEFIDILHRSTLAERRPVDQPGIIDGMLRNANVIITARDGNKLVGISRAITDFYYTTYLSDLAVDQEYQNKGIGKQLIEKTHDHAGKRTMLILLSAPKAVKYYPHIGMTKHDSCWYLPRQK